MALGLPARADSPALHPRAVVHDVHLTYARLVVRGSTVSGSVRLFKDDLDRALAAFAGSRGSNDASLDSLFAAYLNSNSSLASAGRSLPARVVRSGADPDATDPPMWNFQIEASATAPISALSIRIGLLFELYKDQKNIVTLIGLPNQERRSLFFTSDSKTKLVEAAKPD